jgi:hypothetical protein
MNDTIVLLNNLDDEKNNKLQIDEYRVKNAYDSQEDESNIEMTASMVMKMPPKYVPKADKQQENLFVDPK